MKHRDQWRAFFPISICVLLCISCARDFSDSLPGIWEWTGDGCDRNGNCRREIIADEGSRETFTRDGEYRSRFTMNRFSLKGGTILLSRGPKEDPAELGEIISIEGPRMIIRRDGSTRRYERRGGK